MMMNGIREARMSVERRTDRRFEQTDRWLDRIDRRFDRIDRQFDRIEDKMSLQFAWLVVFLVTTFVATMGVLGSMILAILRKL